MMGIMLESDVEMALMDHNNPVFLHHPIIPIPRTLPQPFFSSSQGMSAFSTFDLLH
jgi:hypothetical protein